MNSEQKSQAFHRKRKMMLVLPLLVIPFLTMAFWSLGGGKGDYKQKLSTSGLNLNLPDSKLKDESPLDKLSFYDKADRDSIKLAEEMRSDPYYKEKENDAAIAPTELEGLAQATASKYNQKLNVSPFDKTNTQPEDHVMQKLSLLKKELNKPAVGSSYSGSITDEKDENPHQLSGEVDRLENMIQTQAPLLLLR